MMPESRFIGSEDAPPASIEVAQRSTFAASIGDLWAVDEMFFAGITSVVERWGATIAMPAGSGRSREKFAPQKLGEGIALVELVGLMMKFDGVFSSGNSTTVVRQHLQAIAASPDVAGVLLRIDSPGGMIAGTQDLANDVAAVAARKPVFSYIEDLGVAAAYWVASAASKVFSNSTAFVGGIGTYATIADSSKMADEKGVRVHVIRAGEFKGVGVPGTKVTDAQLGHLQSIVDAQNEHFINTVARGRKMAIDRARKLADGRTHVGDGARQLGLIDGVGSLDSVLARLRGVAKG